MQLLNNVITSNVVGVHLIGNIYCKEFTKQNYAVKKWTKNTLLQQASLLREEIISISIL